MPHPISGAIGVGGNPQNFVRDVKPINIAQVLVQMDPIVKDYNLIHDVDDVGVIKLTLLAALYMVCLLKFWEVRKVGSSLLRERSTKACLCVTRW